MKKEVYNVFTFLFCGHPNRTHSHLLQLFQIWRLMASHRCLPAGLPGPHSFFSGTASYLSLILIINIWLEMNSKHFVTGVTKRVLMTDSKSVAAITDQYDQFGLSLPATLVTTNMSIHRHQKNLTGNVTFPIGNLTFPVGYPSCLLNLPYIAIQTLPFRSPNASQVTWANRQCSGDLHIWICYPLSHLCPHKGPALKICSVGLSNFSVSVSYCPKTILGFVCLLAYENPIN